MLLTMILQSALDKCLPGESDLQKLLNFLSQPRSAKGVSLFCDSHLSDFVARISCYSDAGINAYV
jgi:hypothetical protein